MTKVTYVCAHDYRCVDWGEFCRGMSRLLVLSTQILKKHLCHDSSDHLDSKGNYLLAKINEYLAWNAAVFLNLSTTLQSKALTFNFDVVSSERVGLKAEWQGGVGLVQEQVNSRQLDPLTLKNWPQHLSARTDGQRSAQRTHFHMHRWCEMYLCWYWPGD